MNLARWPALHRCLPGCCSPSRAALSDRTSRPRSSRRAGTAVFDRIGDRGVAIVQGAPKTNGFLVPRQSNEFYHLCGIETPHAYLILDGRDRKVTLFLPPRDARLESAEGKVLSADDAELVKRLTGVDDRREHQGADRGVDAAAARRVRARSLYTPFAPARGTPSAAASSGPRTPPSRRTPGTAGRRVRPTSSQLLRSRFPGREVRDLTPILDELRAVKSPARSP